MSGAMNGFSAEGKPICSALGSMPVSDWRCISMSMSIGNAEKSISNCGFLSWSGGQSEVKSDQLGGLPPEVVDSSIEEFGLLVLCSSKFSGSDGSRPRSNESFFSSSVVVVVVEGEEGEAIIMRL